MSSSPKSKRPAAFAASPRRKEGKRSPLNENKIASKKGLPTLTVYAFFKDFEIEAYVFEKDKNNDDFTYEYKQITDGVKDCNYLTDAGFNAYLNRRESNSNNIQLINDKNFPRNILIRDVSDKGGSSKLTRIEGLKVLKRFFMDPVYAKFPPKDIITVDSNKEEDPHALDEFFLNEDIERIIKLEFKDDDLNCNFFKLYPQLAKKIWSGKYYSDYAHELGYPLL